MKSLILLAVFLSACDINESSDTTMRRGQEQLSRQAVSQVGMPALTNFQEKRILKMIIELRDTEIKTITYTQDMNGKLHKLCDSIGFGIPYATQYTSPMKESEYSHSIVPQADPNGLFSPASAEGTWILCLNKETKKN